MAFKSEKFQSMYEQYSTLQSCQERIGEIDEEVKSLQAMEGEQTGEIAEKIKTLEEEKGSIQGIISYLERKREQVRSSERRFGETVSLLEASNPARQETTKERRKSVQKVQVYIRKLERTGKILGGLEGPLATTQKSIRDILETFFGDDGGARAEKDRQYGITPSEAEKTLARFYVERAHRAELSATDSKKAEKELNGFYRSKEYRDLKSRWNSILKRAERKLKENPVLRTFIESEFARITTMPEEEERGKHLDVLESFIWQEANDEQSKIPLSQDVQSAFHTSHGVYSYESGHKATRLKFREGGNQDALVHDIFCRYDLITAQERDLEYALPSLAAIQLWRRGSLKEYGITAEDMEQLTGINWIAGYWNRIQARRGRPDIQRIGNRKEVPEGFIDEIVAEMQKMTQELIPALNAQRAKMLAEGYGNYATTDIMSANVGLRLKAGEDESASSIESMAPGSDGINLLGATVLRETYQVARRKKEGKDAEIKEIKERLVRTDGPGLIDKMNATARKIQEIREKHRALKAQQATLSRNQTLEDFTTRVTRLEKTQGEQARLRKEEGDIGWITKRTSMGKQKIEAIQRELRALPSEDAIQSGIREQVSDIQRNFNINLTGTPQEQLAQFEIFVQEVNRKIEELNEEEKTLRDDYQRQEKERQELIAQLKRRLGDGFREFDYRVTPL